MYGMYAASGMHGMQHEREPSLGTCMHRVPGMFVHFVLACTASVILACTA